MPCKITHPCNGTAKILTLCDGNAYTRKYMKDGTENWLKSIKYLQ